MALKDSGYAGIVQDKLASLSIEIGNRVTITKEQREYTGILMPRSQVGIDPDHIVIKLDNGYNLGLRIDSETGIRKEKAPRRKPVRHIKAEPAATNRNRPQVSILSTGGTIASRVDYRTGAVNPALTAQDLHDAVPELKDYANVHAKVVMSILSENITPVDWGNIAKKVASEIRRGTDGVVIAHGTDTMGYTAAALSFALQNLPVPVALVGSQRSSDRPSSDAALNLIGAANLVGKGNVAEVMIVMHARTDDSYLYAHRGNRARKLHTSRRDAFQSINSYPLFSIQGSDIKEISAPILRRDPQRRLSLKPNFEEKVALVKSFPGMDGRMIDYLVDDDYKGIVLEGTGLGHTRDSLQPVIKRAIDAGIVVAMTSQCIHGRINMNVYRSGVELLDMGVVPCEDMLSETALVKLMWLLANTKTIDDAKSLMSVSVSGEIDMRSEYNEYNPD